MGKRNRECYLCGERYSYCPTCSQDRTKPAWMVEFHEENCVKIFEICTRFNMKSMSKAVAQNALKTCDLSNKANFKSCVQRDLDVIFAEEKKSRKPKKPDHVLKINPIIEEPVKVVIEQLEEVVESHEVVIEKEENE